LEFRRVLFRSLVPDERAALGVAERAERVVGHGDADRLAMGSRRIVLDGSVEPVAPLLFVHLARPSIFLRPAEVRGLHDLAMSGPRVHVDRKSTRLNS